MMLFVIRFKINIITISEKSAIKILGRWHFIKMGFIKARLKRDVSSITFQKRRSKWDVLKSDVSSKNFFTPISIIKIWRSWCHSIARNLSYRTHQDLEILIMEMGVKKCLMKRHFLKQHFWNVTDEKSFDERVLFKMTLMKWHSPLNLNLRPHQARSYKGSEGSVRPPRNRFLKKDIR